MGFQEAIRTCLKLKYITFSGRASRSEYWYFMLFYFLVLLGITLLFVLLGGWEPLRSGDPSNLFSGTYAIAGVILGLFWIATIIPVTAVVVRRFHDVGLSGWWYLGGLIAGAIPLVGLLATIAVFVVTVLKGTAGDNKFGNDPLVEQGSAEVFA